MEVLEYEHRIDQTRYNPEKDLLVFLMVDRAGGGLLDLTGIPCRSVSSRIDSRRCLTCTTTIKNLFKCVCG
jgi:hypothetical protein